MWETPIFLNDTLLIIAIAVSILLAASFIIFDFYANKLEREWEEEDYDENQH